MTSRPRDALSYAQGQVDSCAYLIKRLSYYRDSMIKANLSPETIHTLSNMIDDTQRQLIIFETIVRGLMEDYLE